ncbi:MAG: hypothetical protein Q7S27_00740 [Nanoarchaeota archaeon]|nr:hypothetical protein [Nanoarchaeota archaeon]
MKKKKKAEKTALIKINSLLYRQVREFVKFHPIEYPSIKHFVENSIMKSLGFKKYDIEGIDLEKSDSKPLVDVVGSPAKYLRCIFCDCFYPKNEKKGSVNVCPICAEAIMQVVISIRNENSNKKIRYKEDLDEA